MLCRLEFPRDERAPAAARQALAEIDLSAQLGQLDGARLQDARLLISELVTNSVQHGAGDTVTVLLDAGMPGRLRCEVIDDGSGFVPRGRGNREIGGWGLDLVEKLSRSWGVHEGSTHVWFELVTDTGSPR